MVSYRQKNYYLDEEQETNHLTGLLLKNRPKSIGILVYVHPTKIHLSKGNLYNYLKVNSLPAFTSIPKQQCLWTITGKLIKGKQEIEVDYFFSNWFTKLEYHLAGPEEQFIDFDKYNSERIINLKEQFFGVKVLESKPIQQTIIPTESVKITNVKRKNCYFCLRVKNDLNDQDVCSECVKELAEYTQL